MSDYDKDLLGAAQRLLARPKGQRGPIATARVRRSISTSYYALFHFLVEEAGNRLLGTSNQLRRRRRTLARTFTHAGMKTALDKVQGANVNGSVSEFLGGPADPNIVFASPIFAQTIARAFNEAQAKRHDADYDLNKPLSASDAQSTRRSVRRAISAWRAANTPADRDFKKALCLLMLLKGRLRPE